MRSGFGCEYRIPRASADLRRRRDAVGDGERALLVLVVEPALHRVESQHEADEQRARQDQQLVQEDLAR